MADEQEIRDSCLDYVTFNRNHLAELLDDPDFPDSWHLDELKELADAADRFTDIIKICQHRSADRRLCDETGIKYEPGPRLSFFIKDRPIP